MTSAARSLAVANSVQLDFGGAGTEVWWTELGEHPAHGEIGRDVLVSLLARFLDRDPATVSLARDGLGKPRLVGEPGIHFSVSRSRSQLVVAIGRRPVGVDIEVVRPVTERTALTTLHLTPGERSEVLRADEPRRDELFLLAWTRKEACAKAIGAGLRISPVMIEAGAGPRLVRTAIRFQDAEYVVEVESCLSAAHAVVSLATLTAGDAESAASVRSGGCRRP
jgi:4'-phosphopantetheinyl transferase